MKLPVISPLFPVLFGQKLTNCQDQTLMLPTFVAVCAIVMKLLRSCIPLHVELTLLGKHISHHNWKLIISELYAYFCFISASSAIGSLLVWMMRKTMKIYQWRLRLSGRKWGGWQTTPASDYVCGTSTRLLRSWAACVSSIWATRNRRPNWSYCNRPLTLYSTWSSKFEVSGCPGRKEEEGKGLLYRIKLPHGFTSQLLSCPYFKPFWNSLWYFIWLHLCW